MYDEAVHPATTGDHSRNTQRGYWRRQGGVIERPPVSGSESDSDTSATRAPPVAAWRVCLITC